MIDIKHHGAVTGVTGSCHELIVGSSGILIDCGLFQGEEAGNGASASNLAIDFPISHIRALVVTHVHIDHVGRIPYLLAAGFEGPIICSEPSAIMLPEILEDALKIGFTRDRALIERVLGLIRSRLVPLPYEQWHSVFDGKDRADRVVIESTYGDKDHESREERRYRLKAVLEHALEDGGTVLVPAFSIGRTQELLYEIESLIHEFGSDEVAPDLPWRDLEIVVDSPLAATFTRIYRDLKPFWDAEATDLVSQGRHPLSFEQLTLINSHEDHLNAVDYLTRSHRPCVVLAGSGMCAGGRVVNYLKTMLADERNDVLFVGYQAKGTPGRDILTYGPRGGWVEFDGKRYDIRARVHQVGGYSAHAGQSDLLRFVKGIEPPPAEIRVVHGDAQAKESLKSQFHSAGLTGIMIPGLA